MRRDFSINPMLDIKKISRESEEGQEIMKQIYGMRLEGYTALGWNIFSKENSKLIKDEFDETSNTTHFAILEEGKVIGSHRATKYSAEDKLPLFKEGHTLELFNTTSTSISELSRLIIRQDKKYPGCVLQLAYHVIDYALKNLSESICSIGIASSKDLFEYIGTKQVNDKIGLVVDKEGEKMLVINTVPILGDKSTLNNNLPLDKYHIDRSLVILTGGKKKFTWQDFWTEFSKEAYDYTNLLPENKKMIEKIASLAGSGKNVLDAGCGTGNLSIKLAENNKVTALDFNESMVGIAAKKTKHCRNVDLKHGDVTKLPFKKNRFDVVTSVNVLYHLDEPKAAIKEAGRVLKEGGLFIASSPLKGAALSKDFMEKVEQDCRKGNVEPEKFSRLKEYNRVIFEEGGLKFMPEFHEMGELLSSNGFKIMHEERIYYDMNFLICAKKIKE